MSRIVQENSGLEQGQAMAYSFLFALTCGEDGARRALQAKSFWLTSQGVGCGLSATELSDASNK